MKSLLGFTPRHSRLTGDLLSEINDFCRMPDHSFSGTPSAIATQRYFMAAHLPTRLHHNAYVTSNMEATRHFYEDLIGMPLVATWCESDELFGKERVYCHCFFGLADGSALAFFQFANPEDQELFGPAMPASPFHHIAVNVDSNTQRLVEGRLKKAGFIEPSFYVLEHGYCRSIYTTDPNGMILELTVDNLEAAAGSEQRRIAAHNELKRWLAGDHNSNNTFRAATHQPA